MGVRKREENYMKKQLIILAMLIGMFTINVNAKEGIYINKNNVRLGMEEYDFISNMFYEGYQKDMSQEDYNSIFSDRDILNNKILSSTYYNEENNISLYAATHESASKLLTIFEFR